MDLAAGSDGDGHAHSAAIGRERLDRIVDDLRQVVPEGLVELAGLATGLSVLACAWVAGNRVGLPEPVAVD